MTDKMSERESVLRDGIALTTGDRNKSYGSPVPNLELQHDLWAAYKAAAGDKHHPAHDAAMQHIFAKIARIACGARGHRDTYVDLATYAAIAFECDAEGRCCDLCERTVLDAEPCEVCDTESALSAHARRRTTVRIPLPDWARHTPSVQQQGRRQGKTSMGVVECDLFELTPACFIAELLPRECARLAGWNRFVQECEEAAARLVSMARFRSFLPGGGFCERYSERAAELLTFANEVRRARADFVLLSCIDGTEAQSDG